MKEPHSEGVANHADLEPCAATLWTASKSGVVPYFKRPKREILAGSLRGALQFGYACAAPAPGNPLTLIQMRQRR